MVVTDSPETKLEIKIQLRIKASQAVLDWLYCLSYKCYNISTKSHKAQPRSHVSQGQHKYKLNSRVIPRAGLLPDDGHRTHTLQSKYVKQQQ